MPDPVVVPDATVVAPALLNLTEWCRDASMTDRRVELLSAFHQIEFAAGRMQATAVEFAGRLADFAAMPA